MMVLAATHEPQMFVMPVGSKEQRNTNDETDRQYR